MLDFVVMTMLLTAAQHPECAQRCSTVGFKMGNFTSSELCLDVRVLQHLVAQQSTASGKARASVPIPQQHMGLNRCLSFNVCNLLAWEISSNFPEGS